MDYIFLLFQYIVWPLWLTMHIACHLYTSISLTTGTFSVIPLCSDVLWCVVFYLSLYVYPQTTLRSKVCGWCTTVCELTERGRVPWARRHWGLWSFAQMTHLFTDAHLSSKHLKTSVLSVFLSRPEAAVLLLNFCWTTEQKDNWSQGKSEKLRERQKNKPKQWMEQQPWKVLVLPSHFLFFFFNHRGCPCTRDIQRLKLFQRRKEPSAWNPKQLSCAVLVVDRGLWPRRCPFFTRRLLCALRLLQLPSQSLSSLPSGSWVRHGSGEEEGEWGSHRRSPSQVWRWL